MASSDYLADGLELEKKDSRNRIFYSTDFVVCKRNFLVFTRVPVDAAKLH